MPAPACASLQEECRVEKEALAAQVQAADEAAAAAAARIAAQEEAAAQRSAQLDESLVKLDEVVARLDEREAVAAEAEATVAEREAAVAEREAALDAAEARIAERDVDLVEREHALRASPARPTPTPGKHQRGVTATPPLGRVSEGHGDSSSASEEERRLREALSGLEATVAAQQAELTAMRQERPGGRVIDRERQREQERERRRRDDDARAVAVLNEEAVALRQQLRDARAAAAAAEATVESQARRLAAASGREGRVSATNGIPFGDGDTYIPQSVFEDALEEALRKALSAHLGEPAAAGRGLFPSTSTPARTWATIAAAEDRSSASAPHQEDEISILTERLHKAEEMRELLKGQLVIAEEAGQSKLRQVC